MTTHKTLILILGIGASLLSIRAVHLPALHLVTHVEEINSDRVFVSDIRYDSIGRRIYQSNGLRNTAHTRHAHDSIIQRFSTAIRYAGDSIIYTFGRLDGGSPSINVLVLDSLGNYISLYSKVTYNNMGRVVDEVNADREAHFIIQGNDIIESYGWSRSNDRIRKHHIYYIYYDGYDTRCYGVTKGRQDRQRLYRQSTSIYSDDQKSDTIVADYSYEYGIDERILTETRQEHNSAIHHLDSWTARYTYAD